MECGQLLCEVAVLAPHGEDPRGGCGGLQANAGDALTRSQSRPGGSSMHTFAHAVQ